MGTALAAFPGEVIVQWAPAGSEGGAGWQRMCPSLTSLDRPEGWSINLYPEVSWAGHPRGPESILGLLRAPHWVDRLCPRHGCGSEVTRRGIWGGQREMKSFFPLPPTPPCPSKAPSEPERSRRLRGLHVQLSHFMWKETEAQGEVSESSPSFYEKRLKRRVDRAFKSTLHAIAYDAISITEKGSLTPKFSSYSSAPEIPLPFPYFKALMPTES